MTSHRAWGLPDHHPSPLLARESHTHPTTVQIWAQQNINLSRILSTLLLGAFVYTLNGGNALHGLLFLAKSILLRLKNIMHRFTGVLRPCGALAHKTVATPLLNRTRLSLLSPGLFQQKPVGLGNFDFSCYQNSIIQSLASLVSLPKFLHHVLGSEKSTKSVTTAILRETLDVLNSPQDKRMIWLPSLLKSMSSSEQQDAQEYYAKILDQLDEEEIAQKKSTGQAMGLESLHRGFKLERTATGNDSEEQSQPRNPLEGFVAQRVGCLKCGHSDGISMIPFNCLTVPLPPYNSCYISECLDEFTNLEYIEGVECPKCTLLSLKAKLDRVLSVQKSDALQSRLTAVQAALDNDDFSDATLKDKCDLPRKLWTLTTKSKQSAIGRPPKCLVVHVNRSRFDEQTFALYKDHANVRFPIALDLGPWCVSELASARPPNSDSPEQGASLPRSISDPSGSMLPSYSEDPATRPPPSDWQYELRAAIIHHGRHENGHYICYRKYPPAAVEASEQANSWSLSKSRPSFEGWWELSDDDVAQVSEGAVRQQGQVFMLFYELIADSSGKEDAILRIASCTPLPDETGASDDELAHEHHDNAGSSDATDKPIRANDQETDLTSSSSEEETPGLERARPSSFPLMVTGMGRKSEGEETLGHVVTTVNVI